MGRDKTWLIFEGQPLVLHLARHVLPIVQELIISTNTPEDFGTLLETLPIPVRLVPDQFPGAGPVAGLHAGLDAAAHDLVLLLAVDMPLVNPDLLGYLASLAPGFDAVVPQVPHPQTRVPVPEPLHACYRRSCLPAISAHLAAGHRRMVSFLPDVKTRFVPPEEIASLDPDFLSFLNVNTPEEWEEVKRRTPK
ncbi:MAG: hypothetical protein AUK03_12625 [Anaerolineae bacterium CG2_30_64_16]|nr:MAG: hypothetical protein AUK03_12625 [Anaerolineae bacterium CG2_30_64_16]